MCMRKSDVWSGGEVCEGRGVWVGRHGRWVDGVWRDVVGGWRRRHSGAPRSPGIGGVERQGEEEKRREKGREERQREEEKKKK